MLILSELGRYVGKHVVGHAQARMRRKLDTAAFDALEALSLTASLPRRRSGRVIPSSTAELAYLLWSILQGGFLSAGSSSWPASQGAVPALAGGRRPRGDPTRTFRSREAPHARLKHLREDVQAVVQHASCSSR